MRRLLLLPALLWSACAPAQTAPPMPPVDDGRMFGHFPYADVGAAALVPAPPGFAVGQRCLLQPAVIPSLRLLLAAKAASGVPGTLHGLDRKSVV